MKRQDNGRTGKPRRRVREGVTNAWKMSEQPGIQEKGGTYIGIIVLAQDVENPAVEGWFDVVELVDIRMLDPIDDHLTPNDNEKW